MGQGETYHQTYQPTQAPVATPLTLRIAEGTIQAIQDARPSSSSVCLRPSIASSFFRVSIERMKEMASESITENFMELKEMGC